MYCCHLALLEPWQIGCPLTTATANSDNTLGDYVYITVKLAAALLSRIGAISSILPIFMLLALFSVSIGVMCGEMYTRTAVTVKKLISSSHSPVFSQFGDTMTGLSVIRATGGMPQVFYNQMAKRMRPLSRSQEADFNLNRWMSVRIDFVTALVSVCAGIIAVSKASALAAGLVGFSLSNVTGLSMAMILLVRYMNELEVQFQSVCLRRNMDTQFIPDKLTRLLVVPSSRGIHQSRARGEAEEPENEGSRR